MSKLWTFGCSFTAEYDFTSYLKPGQSEENENNNIRYRNLRGGEVTDVWPTIVARELGLEKENVGYPGFSNYRIFNRFVANCHRIQKDDVVIVEWSRKERFDIVNKNMGRHHQWVSVIPSEAHSHIQYDIKVMQQILVNRTNMIWCDEIYSFMKLIKELSLAKQFELYFWSADKHIINKEDKEFKLKFKCLVPEADTDMTKFLRIYGAKSFHEETLRELPDDEHYGEVGHKVMAEYFLRDINRYRNNLYNE
jgi:hypothetical protein